MSEKEVNQSDSMSFWDHLDILRGSLIKICISAVCCGIFAFIFKDEVFDILLSPSKDSFIIYRILDDIVSLIDNGNSGTFDVQLINTGLSTQFMIHMKTSIYIGFMLSSPYALYLIFRFISPALYANEREYTTYVVCWGYLMFIAGILLSYFLVFPLTFRFLGTYQVSEEITNMISLESYMDTLLMMSMALGIIFELPILCWLFAKLGFLSASYMRRFRRHAIVLILIVAAIITPTSDVFTMTLVAMPIWLLFELSILIVGHSQNKNGM